MFFNFLVYALVGRLLIFLWAKAPYKGWLSALPVVGNFFKDLFSCNLCLGVWVFWLLDFLFKVNLLEIALPPILLEFLTGSITSFLVWVFDAGWNTLFRNFIISGSED